MRTVSSSIPRVLIALPTVQKACRDKLKGVLRYAQRHGPWDVQTLEDHPFIARLGTFKNWHPDGLIRGSRDLLPANSADRIGVPTVVFDYGPTVSPYKWSVTHDANLIGTTVADAFFACGLINFGFVGSVPEFYWSQSRATAFAKRVEELGYACAFYRPRYAEDWGIEQHYLRKWLEALPKPCGVMVAVDLRAKQVLDTCLAAGIRVPEAIAVIGVDNDETVCEHTVPTLSSVLPDFEGGGYLAAELLDRLMRDAQTEPIHLSYGVRQVVHRQSSQYVLNTNRLASTAAEYIRLNACKGITVPDVASHLRVSRRLAEVRFRETYGRSLLDEIQRCRLEQVCILLRETRLPIREIGEECGYETENYLKTRFKKIFGMTMREYRKKTVGEGETERPNTC